VSQTLYEIADLRGIIDAALEESGGELTPEIEAALTAWDEKFADKAERVALYICEQEAHANAAKAEAKRLNDLAASRLKRCASLERYLLSQMVMVGKERIDGVLKTIAVAKNPPSVRGELAQADLRTLYIKWTNGDAPPFAKMVPESYTLDKDAVKAAAKAGQPIPAGLSVERGISLRIK
jgi:hypothetical protein